MLESSGLHARDELFSGLVASHLLGKVELQLADHLSLLLFGHSPTSRTRNLLDFLNFRQ